MPFPLAHPAAVLPLRRFCPGILSFPALVLGSLVPDAGYLLANYQVDQFSHSLPGLVGFALPVGLVALLVFQGLGALLLRWAPAGTKAVIASVRLVRPPWSLGVVLSLLIGAATHLAWDSLTHNNGWLVEQAAFLRRPVLEIGHHTVRLCHVLWYVSTFAGIACLMMAGLGRLQKVEAGPPGGGFKGRLGRALLFAALMIPVAMIHHLVRSWPGEMVVALLAALLGLTLVFWLGVPRRLAADRRPSPGTNSPSPTTPRGTL